VNSSIFSSETLRRYARLPGRTRAWHAALALMGALVYVAAAALLRARFGGTDRLAVRADPLERTFGPAETLFVGSSLVATDINPSLFPFPAANLTAKGMDYVMMEKAARRLMPLMPRLRCAVIETYIYPLRADVIETHGGDFGDLYALGIRLRDFPRHPYWKLKQFLSETVFRGVFFLSRLTPRSLFWPPKARLDIPRYTEGGVVAGHAPSRGVLAEGTSARDWIASQRLNLRYDRFTENVDALLRMAKAFREHGVRVVFLRFPHHASYLSEMPAEWDREFDRMLEALRAQAGADFQYLDLRHAPGLADADFQDAVHLNSAGAAKMAGLLGERLGPLLDER
jgi:hypothetical protein